MTTANETIRTEYGIEPKSSPSLDDCERAFSHIYTGEPGDIDTTILVNISNWRKSLINSATGKSADASDNTVQSPRRGTKRHLCIGF
jgi:hypothetical protein